MLLAEKTKTLAAPAFLEYHADDYGLFPAQSRRILRCYHEGRLNGVSVMANGWGLETSMAELAPELENIAVTVHLNLIEGRCLTEPMAGLTEADGTFRCGFGNLLLRSFLPGQGAVRAWLREELRAQIRAVAAFLPKGAALRLDGHAHYHMLPIVFDALMDVIREDGLEVSYIRIPREYPGLYLRHLGKLHDFSAINLVKVLILNLLAARNERKYGDYLENLEKRVFLGVFLSGRMDRENVEPVLPGAVALAKKKGWGVEILAHPGSVEEPEDIARLTNADDVAFLTSSMRGMEASLFER